MGRGFLLLGRFTQVIRGPLTRAIGVGGAIRNRRMIVRGTFCFRRLIKSSTWATPLVCLAALVDSRFLDDRFGSMRQIGQGQFGLPTRPVAGSPFILKHVHKLSDEVLGARWIEARYSRVLRSWRLSAGEAVLKIEAGLQGRTSNHSRLLRLRRGGER